MSWYFSGLFWYGVVLVLVRLLAEQLATAVEIFVGR
jgi:hypothetical protein